MNVFSETVCQDRVVEKLTRNGLSYCLYPVNLKRQFPTIYLWVRVKGTDGPMKIKDLVVNLVFDFCRRHNRIVLTLKGIK